MKVEPAMRFNRHEAPSNQAGLEIGKILRQSLRLYGAAFPALLLILLFFSIPELLYAEFSGNMIWVMHSAGIGLKVAGWTTQGIEILIQTLFFGLGQGAVCMAVSRHIDGHGASFPLSVMGALGLFGPLAAIAVLYMAGLVAGALILIFPGLVFATICYVVIPVCVFERRGIGACFARSADLTRGYRWPLFRLVLTVNAIILAMNYLIGRYLPPMGPVDDILSWLIVVLLYAFEAVLVVVTYRELNGLRGAGDSRYLARVFD